jgi:hypothetical protein
MEIQRQHGRNYGTIDKLWQANAADYAAIQAALVVSEGVFTDAIIDDFFFAVEFEFEKGTWSQEQVNAAHGDYFEHSVSVSIRKYNDAVAAYVAHWWYKKVLCLVIDFQERTLLIGSDSEPMRFKSSKPKESGATAGVNTMVELTGLSRKPL